MADVIRWGILGTGGISHQFARGLSSLTDGKLVAVGSRTLESAEKFAKEFGADRAHEGYDALANDPDMDAIYIGVPHPYHFENAMRCLNAGKPVLCEKPFTINAGELEKLIATAREKQIFLMEAMWTRYFPAMIKLRELIADGAIGDVRMIQAHFGFRTEFRADHRLFAPELGGGALLDVGIYPISFASMILGEPSEVTSTAELGETGVDEQSAYLFKYAGGQIAILSSATRTAMPIEAMVIGTTGRIKVEHPFYMPSTLTLTPAGGEPVTLSLPFEGNGYNYEAAEVGRCLREGLLESPTMPLDESLRLMRILDGIRAEWGLVYPSEK